MLPFARKCFIQPDGSTYAWFLHLLTWGYGKLGINALAPLIIVDRIVAYVCGIGGSRGIGTKCVSLLVSLLHPVVGSGWNNVYKYSWGRSFCVLP